MGPTKPVVSNSTTSSTMESPLPPPPSCAAPLRSSAMQVPLVAPPPQPPNLKYPDSVDSSSGSRNMDSWDESYAATTTTTSTTTKLRFMCSYGGYIVPRPHDKSLCYLGGVTRMIVIDRHSSLSVLSSRLSSEALLDGRPFILKYQLPSEDLDSLISITSDEDLDNMIDEYDRLNTANPSVKPSRIRLFLFAVKPKSSHSVGPILDSSAKSEDWFWNALNSTGVHSKGLSDSASGSGNCLLSIDDDIVGNNLALGSKDVEAGQAGSFVKVKNVKQGQDGHSVPDSPMLDTTSSFGSASSSPSLANLRPILVHMNNGNVSGSEFKLHDQKVGIEEQLARMSVGGGGLKQDEDFTASSSPPSVAVAGLGVPVNVPVSGGEHQNRVSSDDEKSDHGLPVAYRKPPPPQPQTRLQPQPQSLPLSSQQQASGGIDLLSPDSVSSDNSFTNAMSRTKPSMYQDPFQVQSGSTRVPSNSVDPKLDMSDPNARVQMQPQFQDSGYRLQPQYEQYQQETQQQPLLHDTHYIQHLPPGSVPIQAYYTVYPSQQQTHPRHLHQLDQQYEALYYLHAGQAQAYNLSVQQPNISEPATGFPPNRQTPPNPAVVLQPSSFNHLRNTPISKPEMVAAPYRTAAAGTQQLVQAPSSQHKQQYVGYSQIHPSESVPPSSVANANYSYELSDPVHSKQQYTQTKPPTMHQ